MTTTNAHQNEEKGASQAEYAVIGSILIGEKHVLDYAINEVEPEHFVDPKNKMLFKALKRMHGLGVPIDATTVEGHLTPYEKKMIGAAHLLETTDRVKTTQNVRHYHRIMRNRSLAAQLNQQYEKLRADPFSDDARKMVSSLWDQLSGNGHSVVPLKDAVVRYRETLERRRTGREFRVVTGYLSLDGKIGGFYGGNLVAVGARTSLGKTSLLLNMAMRFMKQGLKILFVSAEMVTDEILDRMVAMDADVPISTLRRGRIPDDRQVSVSAELDKYATCPMMFLEGGKMGLSRLRNAVEVSDPSVVFVDFIQRFVPPNPAMNRAAYFSDLVNELKALAMQRKIVVFASSQLNREIEKEGGRAPMLSDFKESGGIEEASDIALMLQQKNPTKKDDPVYFDSHKRIILWIRKHRNGPTGKITFIFTNDKTAFHEEEEELLPPPMDQQNQPEEVQEEIPF